MIPQCTKVCIGATFDFSASKEVTNSLDGVGTLLYRVALSQNAWSCTSCWGLK